MLLKCDFNQNDVQQQQVKREKMTNISVIFIHWSLVHCKSTLLT